MRLLLDTHVVLWQLQDTRRLSDRAHEAVAGAEELNFSSVSFAEIGIKAAIGKLDVPAQFLDNVRRAGLRVLGLAPEHGLGVAELPMHHRDPFDRLLIAQARTEGLTLVTADRRFGAYDVPLISA